MLPITIRDHSPVDDDRKIQSTGFYSYRDLWKFHKQTFRNNKLNRHCEHVIRNGEPIKLTQEQREQFIRNICNIPDNPVGLGMFCGMAVYVFLAGLLVLFTFVMAFGFSQVNKLISCLLFVVGTVLLLLVLAGFVGQCRKNRKRTDRFRAENREKISRGDYQSYAYKIEEIYRVQTYDEDVYGGYLNFWYRVGDVMFELPNTAFAYKLGNNHEIIYRNPEQMELNERSRPVGGYIIGMLIHLDGQERFYGM